MCACLGDARLKSLQSIYREEPSMTNTSTHRPRRRIGAIALVALTLMGAAATTASAEPDTNIQKPGHVTYQVA
jgi:hypothetical protein